MKNKFAYFCSAFVLTIFLVTTNTYDVAAENSPVKMSVEQAKEELRLAVDFIKTFHPDPYWATDQNTFDAKVAEIMSGDKAPTEAEHFFHLAEIYSMVYDTHTQLYPTLDNPVIKQTYPIRLRLFDEGLFIVGADDPYRALVGKRIVRAGGMPMDEVIKQASNFSFSENDFRKKVFAEMYFFWPELYAYLGLTNEDGSVELVVETLDGERSSARLNETENVSFAQKFRSDYTAVGTDEIPEHWTSLQDVYEFELPLYLQHLDRNYFYHYFEDEKTIYVQLNRPDNQSADDIALDFQLEWFDVLRKNEVERFILDVRNNPGGWINIAEPIPALLSAHRVDDYDLRTYIVLTGTDSVSAASLAVAEMEYALSTTITIGQPTGSGANLFLNTERTMLPYSKIEIETSSVMMPFRAIDDRAYIAPDIAIPYSFRDYIAGRDPVLETALSVTKEMREKLLEGKPAMQPWNRKSQQGVRARQ